jgi:penicillin amidase
VVGSNNWVVPGSRSVHGGAIVANDMHLALTSPGIWYRTQFEWNGRSAGGLTLPGAPGLVTGSNCQVAWGFTNTTGDFQDYVVIEVNPDDAGQYRTPEGWAPFETITESIAVRGRGRAAESMTLRSTRWGIVVRDDWRGRPLALKWVALLPQAVNMRLMGMMEVESVEAGIDAARTFGMPSQNIVMADRGGHIGWIISGYLPRRRGFEGLRPRSWAGGDVGWDGALDEAQRPTLLDPAAGVIYTANNRTIGDESSRLIGHAWASGYRAFRIAELLAGRSTFSERDLLAIQLDTRTIVFDLYRDLILEAARGSREPAVKETAKIVRAWNGSADTDQAALRLLEAFRRTLHAKVFAPLTAPCRTLDGRFAYRWPFSEETLRRILEERPQHLLASRYASWSELLQSSLRDTLEDLATRNPQLTLDVPWGETNRAAIGHPLAMMIPQMSGALSMPPDPLPGHWSAVRMATPGFGASARMVVSPGHESQGILHMPSGQSGHPMSPHFRDGHAAWVSGAPTAFLPGEPASRLLLTPAE